MKTCKLEIKEDIQGNDIYNAILESTIKHPTGKNIVTKLDEIRTAYPDQAIDFLVSYGVEYDEVLYAINEMTEKGHNQAGFGIFGSFISSWFEGVTH